MSLPRVLAVDCGAGHLACGLLSSDKAGRLQLEKLALDAFNPDASLEEEWTSMIAQALAETARREKFSGLAAVGLPGHHILGKFIKIPTVEESKRAKIVQFEAQQNIPYSLDEVIWDYEVVAEQGLDLELMLAAAKTEVVEGACAALATSKLSVVSVTSSSVAVTRCFRHNYPEAAGSAIIADIGARSTNLIFVDAERFFVRTIPLAGNTLTQAIADEIKNDFTQLGIYHLNSKLSHRSWCVVLTSISSILKISQDLLIDVTKEVSSFYRVIINVLIDFVDYLTKKSSILHIVISIVKDAD
jgi:type IV pilus assembly protein PilM